MTTDVSSENTEQTEELQEDQPGYKILVVDDEPDLEPLVRQRMRREIRSGRYSFVFAHNGVEALKELEDDDDIDMVLSDINMPQMDGLTLLQEIPKAKPNVRSVIISAYGDMQNIRTAMNRGAFDFITKPVDFDDLRVTIDRTLRHIQELRDALSVRDRLVAIQNELDVAKNMQQSILPTVFPSGSGYSVYGTMRPARNIGGDFFDLMRLQFDRIGLVVADVSDKGVAAGLFMMSSRTLLKGAAVGKGHPGEVLTEVNSLLVEDNETGMFVTVLYSVFDPRSGRLTYASGGENPPVLVRADGSSEELPLTQGIVLGVAPNYDYMENSVDLAPGDSVIFVTDGVTEAMNEAQEPMGIQRVRDHFAQSPPTDPESTALAVIDVIREFAGSAAQHDDITCLVLRRDD
ncbi:MAG: SpoIIE family protein phosphatase [Chloroflexi bacterium]|nr:SpoIIE family protein phosphatase [Chloroflexota bacterium]